MKMKELEARTGVGREAIRNYIREGLLPEPEKPHRNVAYYTEDHVSRIGLIRKLKDERFLPLGVIRDLLDTTTADSIPEFNLDDLESLLTDRLVTTDAAPTPVAQIIASISLSSEELDFLVIEGFVAILETPDGPALSARDTHFIQTCAQLRDIGFDTESGYLIDGLIKYKASADALAKQEIDEFYERLAGTRSTDDAAQLVEKGLELTGQVFTALRTKAILRCIAERNAEDRKSDQAVS